MLKTTSVIVAICSIAFPNQLSAIESGLVEPRLVETTKSISLNIEADSDQNLALGFDSFLQQAETLANQAIQTEFNNSSQLQRLNITVSLSRRGMVAPILTGSIERSQVISQAGSGETRLGQTWSRQIARSAELLGYVTIPPIAKRSPVVNSAKPSVYSAGFFKVNRPANRFIPSNLPPGFPANFSPNYRSASPKSPTSVQNSTPVNIPVSPIERRDD